MSLRAPLLAVRRAPGALALASSRSLPTLSHAARGCLAFSSSAAKRDSEKTLKSYLDTARRNVADGKRSPPAKESEPGLRMVLTSKPGGGKMSTMDEGTRGGYRLVQTYDIAFISTGDVLRHQIASKSDIGQKAEAIVASGGLVPDDLMLELVLTELEAYHGKSWILDGFPRTMEQGKLIDKVLREQGRPFNMIVHLNVPDAVILERITARWVHLPSGRVYNDTYNPPKVAGVDDVTGEPLSKRPDDTPEVFTKRLKAYYNQTAPLLEYFAHDYPDALHSIAGNTSDELWPKLQHLVDPEGLAARAAALGYSKVMPVRSEADDLRDQSEAQVGDKMAHIH